MKTLAPDDLAKARDQYIAATQIETLCYEDVTYLESLLECANENGIIFESMGFQAERLFLDEENATSLENRLHCFEIAECNIIKFYANCTLTVDVTKPLKEQALSRLKMLAVGVQKMIEAVESCNAAVLDERDLKAVKKLVSVVKGSRSTAKNSK